MNPSLIIVIAAIFSILGGLGYSYHEGRVKGTQICEAEKLAAELKKTKLELKLAENLSELQLKEIGEAQTELDEQTRLNGELNEKLAKLPLKSQSDCIPDSVLDSIREFRLKSKDNYSKPPKFGKVR